MLLHGFAELWRFKSFKTAHSTLALSGLQKVIHSSEEPETPSKFSSLSPTRATSSKTHRPNLKVLNINCQSIVNKKAEFQAIIDEHKLDIVVGTDYWLNKNNLNSEIFPKSLVYFSFRQDREADTCGGEALILVKDTLITMEQKQLKTNCELIWVKIDMVTTKPIYIAAYYRPKEGDTDSIQNLGILRTWLHS